MTKKIVSLTFAALIFLLSVIPAFSVNVEYVTASNDVFVSDKELSELNRFAAELHNNCGYKFCCNLTDDMGEYTAITDYAEQLFEKDNTSKQEGGMFVYSTVNNQAYFYCTKEAEKILTKEVQQSVYFAFAMGSSYYKGLNGIYEYLEKVFAAQKKGEKSPMISPDDVPSGSMPSYPTTNKIVANCITDRAKLVPYDKMNELVKFLDEKSEEHRCKISVITVSEVKSDSPKKYVKSIYKNGNYGYKDSKDGILLMIYEKNCFIACGGKAVFVMNPGVNYFALKNVRAEIQAGHYVNGIKAFAEITSTVFQWFTLAVCILVLIILLIFIVILVKRRKNKKQPEKAEENLS